MTDNTTDETATDTQNGMTTSDIPGNPATDPAATASTTDPSVPAVAPAAEEIVQIAPQVEVEATLAIPLSTAGTHTIAIGSPDNLFTYDVDSEGNILNFKGVNETTKDATTTI